MKAPGAVLGVLILVSAASMRAPAQSWRTLTARRPLGGADSLHVRVRYDAGRISLSAAAAPLLYDAQARFDADQQRLSRSYDPTSRTLRVGVDSTVQAASRGSRGIRGDGRLDIALAAGIPLDLDLNLGATHAMLDLSTLWLDSVSVMSAATEADLTFGTANQQPMRELYLDAGVGSITVHALGNARARRVTIASTVGGVDLDMSGSWTGEMPMTLRLALGTATLRVPRDAGVALRLTRRIASIDADGFTERDGVLYSANYEQMKRHIIVDGSATLSTMDIVWRE